MYKKLAILSEVEYGATYQCMDDKYSDIDKMILYARSLEEMIFTNQERSVKQSGDIIKYPLERFIYQLYQNDFHFVLLLCAQLEQNKDTDVNKKVFYPLYQPQQFQSFILGQMSSFIASIMGMAKRMMLQAEVKMDENGNSIFMLPGKKYIYLETAMYHLKQFNHVFQTIPPNFDEYLKYETLTKVSDEDIQQKVIMKREYKIDISWDDMKKIETNLLLTKQNLYKYQDIFYSYEVERDRIFEQLKSNAAQFLVETLKK